MLKALLSRRHLITVALAAGGAWFGQPASLLAAGGNRARSTAGYDSLAALCSDLRCPERIGTACLRALPAAEASAEDLARLILADLPPAVSDRPSVMALKRSVGERSRHDFRDDKTVEVDGWMLSLTEARAYALAVLLAEQPDQRPNDPTEASR
jgi:hypothetical protein